MLAQWHEGNLLALAQSLDKLALLYPDGLLTLIRIEEALNRNNHFTPFQLVDTLLSGQAKRAQRILRQLESEGTEVIILLRTLQKNCCYYRHSNIHYLKAKRCSLFLIDIKYGKTVGHYTKPLYSAYQ